MPQNISKSSASTTYPPATAGGTDAIQARRVTFEGKPREAKLYHRQLAFQLYEGRLGKNPNRNDKFGGQKSLIGVDKKFSSVRERKRCLILEASAERESQCFSASPAYMSSFIATEMVSRSSLDVPIGEREKRDA